MLAAMPVAAASAAQPQTQPAPAPQWVLDESGFSCSLARRLQREPEVTFVLRTIVGTGRYELRLVGLRVPRPSNREQQISFSFGPGDRPLEQAASGSIGAVAGRPSVMFSVEEDLVAGLAGASSISLASGSRTLAEHPLPQAAAAARALRGCESRLLIEWGADPAGFEPGAVRPKAASEVSGWISYDSLRADADSTSIVARLNIGIDGRPESCTLLESVGFNSPPPAVCTQLMERARYEPARGPRGNAVRSVAVYHLNVRRAMFTTTEPIR
jgi:hypothetical protein